VNKNLKALYTLLNTARTVGWQNIEEKINRMYIPFFPKKNINDKNTYFAPMQSMVQIKGSLSSPSPAMTGWQKYGPNLKLSCGINS
jgi:hypothetical protein